MSLEREAGPGPEDLDGRVPLGRRILQSEAFKPFIKYEYLPGADVQTEDEVRAHIRKWSKTGYHPVGSCKMGQDELSVVDTQLRVHGLDGLRVVDASIMPTLISGNTQHGQSWLARRAPPSSGPALWWCEHTFREAPRGTEVAAIGAAGARPIKAVLFDLLSTREAPTAADRRGSGRDRADPRARCAPSETAWPEAELSQPKWRR
jgi:hypothetical protein